MNAKSWAARGGLHMFCECGQAAIGQLLFTKSKGKLDLVAPVCASCASDAYTPGVEVVGERLRFWLVASGKLLGRGSAVASDGKPKRKIAKKSPGRKNRGCKAKSESVIT